MSLAPNCTPFPVCCEPVYGYSYAQTEFLSSEISGSCPTTSLGGPFTLQPGSFYSDVSQADADAQAQTYLAFLIAQGCVPIPVPVVASATMAYTAGVAFTYQIVATGSPTSYGATPLPSGVSLNATTGLISGTIASGTTTYTINLSATNAGGSSVAGATLTLRAAKAVMSFSQTGGTSGGLGITSFQIGLDGAGYTSGTLGTTYRAYSQFKYKFILSDGTWPSTYSIQIGQTITSISSLVSGTITATGNITTSVLGQGDLYVIVVDTGNTPHGLVNPQDVGSGAYSLSATIPSSLTLKTNTQAFEFADGSSGTFTVTGANQAEVILNF